MARKVARLLAELVSEPDWRAARLFLMRHQQDLLSEKADTELARDIATAGAEGRDGDAARLSHHRAWLASCRAAGVDFAPVPEGGTDPGELMLFVQQAVIASNQYLEGSDEEAMLDALVSWKAVFDHPAFSEAPDFVRHSVAEQFGEVLVARFQATGDPIELQRVADACLQLEDFAFPGSPASWALLDGFRRCQHQLALFTRDREVFGRALGAAVLITTEMPPSAPDWRRYQHSVGYLLIDRWQLFAELDDLDRAAAIFHRLLLDTPPTATEELVQVNSSLSAALRVRYDQVGEIQDIDRAVIAGEECVIVTRGDPAFVMDLGQTHLTRFRGTSDPQSLDRAIACFEDAADRVPSSEADYWNWLNDFGFALTRRYELTGEPEDLDRAVALHDSGARGTPPGSRDRARHLLNLSAALSSRSRVGRSSQSSEELERAITLSEQAMAEWPDEEPPADFRQSAAGTRFARYLQTGAAEDLEHSTSLLLTALATPSPDTSTTARLHRSLAALLKERFGATGDLEHLEESLRHYESALSVARPGSWERPEILMAAADALTEHAPYGDESAELATATGYAQEAANSLPPQARLLPRVLNTLANTHSAAYRLTRRPEELAQAVSVLERAAELGGETAPTILTNLADALREAAAGSLPADHRRALEAARSAVAQTSPESPELPHRLYVLARILMDGQQRTGGDAVLSEATTLAERACVLGLQSNSLIAFMTGRAWGDWAAGRGDWPSAQRAYGYAHRAAGDLFRVQTARRHRESSLGVTQDISGRLAYALSRSGALEEAVVALEQGRTRLLNEALGRRNADLTALGAEYPDLAARFDAAATRLRALELGELRALPGTGTGDLPEARTAAAREAKAAFSAVIDEIRSVPGWTDFLGEPTFARVREATGTVIAIQLNYSSAGGHALLLRDGSVRQIDLPLLTTAAVTNEISDYLSAYQERQRAPRLWEAALSRLLSWLWDSCMGAVVEALPDVAAAHLLPGGLLGLLPLHAAATKDAHAADGRRYALDHLRVSYAPSITALDDAVGRAATLPHDTLLVLGDPQRRDLPSLNHVAREVEAIRSWFASPIVLEDGRATRGNALKTLRDATVVHMACHGQAEPLEPLRSALLLADGALTVADLLGSGGLTARIAVLSACESATLGLRLPEEAISFPTALLQSGAAGIVGTLWAVPDLSAMVLMTAFYRFWRHDQQSPAEALQAAQTWLRSSTNEEVRALMPDVAELQGPDSPLAARIWATGHGFAEPVHWAAFAHFGA